MFPDGQDQVDFLRYTGSLQDEFLHPLKLGKLYPKRERLDRLCLILNTLEKRLESPLSGRLMFEIPNAQGSRRYAISPENAQEWHNLVLDVNVEFQEIRKVYQTLEDRFSDHLILEPWKMFSDEKGPLYSTHSVVFTPAGEEFSRFEIGKVNGGWAYVLDQKRYSLDQVLGAAESSVLPVFYVANTERYFLKEVVIPLATKKYMALMEQRIKTILESISS